MSHALNALRSLFRRLHFLLIGRRRLAARFQGFHADPLSYIDESTKLSDFNRFTGKCLVTASSIGSYTYAINARIGNSSIGKFCSIGPETMIGALGRHPTDWLSTSPTFYSTLNQAGTSFTDTNFFDELKTVQIGNDVWIGARVTVLDGVKVGDGAIIAAGSVVTKDVMPYTIVGGIPAKRLRDRMPPAHAETLRALGWWDWPEASLRNVAELFRQPVDDRVLSQLVEYYSTNLAALNTTANKDRL